MNKDLLNQIPVEERPVASKINSLVEDMQPSQAFQWNLENQLMNKATTMQPAQGWFIRIMVPVGWVIAAVFGALLLNWTFRSLVPQPSPAAGPTATQQVSFAESVRSGNTCRGPLALGHGFAVFLTDPEKTEFVALDRENTIGELRSFAWSTDGKQLAIVGNSSGSGNIYLTDPSGNQPQPVLANGELGYLMDAAWSRDGKQLILWSSQNNKIVYLLSADGTGLIEVPLDVQILGTPQFAPDGRSIFFYGADSTSTGLFQAVLDRSQVRKVSPFVEDETGFAISPDGLQLAFVSMDRVSGKAILMTQEMETGAISFLGSLPIPKGSGSSIPESANLSWSADGTSLVFDFGRNAADRAVYLAYADGREMVKAADAAYAPAISADGKCLAYISDNRVFLMDFASVSAGSTVQPPLRLGELPPGRGIPNFKQDKLQWRPGNLP